MGRILSPAALIDVTRKSRRNLKTAAEMSKRASARERGFKLQSLSFHEVRRPGLPSFPSYVSRVLSGLTLLLSTSRSHHACTTEDRPQKTSSLNSPSGEFRFPAAVRKKRMRQTAESLIWQRKTRHVKATLALRESHRTRKEFSLSTLS